VRHEPHSMHIWRYSVKAIYLKGFGEPELLELKELPGPIFDRTILSWQYGLLE
jgi:hypothetical protein